MLIHFHVIVLAFSWKARASFSRKSDFEFGYVNYLRFWYPDHPFDFRPFKRLVFYISSGRLKSVVVQVGALNLHDTLEMVRERGEKAAILRS